MDIEEYDQDNFVFQRGTKYQANGSHKPKPSLLNVNIMDVDLNEPSQLSGLNQVATPNY